MSNHLQYKKKERVLSKEREIQSNLKSMTCLYVNGLSHQLKKKEDLSLLGQFEMPRVRTSWD